MFKLEQNLIPPSEALQGQEINRSASIEESSGVPLTKGQHKDDEQGRNNNKTHTLEASQLGDSPTPSNKRGVQSKEVVSPPNKHRRGKSKISLGLLPALGSAENGSYRDAYGGLQIEELTSAGLDVEKLVREGNLVGTLLQQVGIVKPVMANSQILSDGAANFFQDELESMSSGAEKEREDPRLGNESIFSSSLLVIQIQESRRRIL